MQYVCIHYQKEEDIPFNWGPGTENYPTTGGNPEAKEGIEKKGPTEEEWENSSIRGFTLNGKECRVVPWYDHGPRFVEREMYGNGFSYEGDQALLDFPALTRKLAMGRAVGYTLRDHETGREVPSPPVNSLTFEGGWITLGKTDTHRGVAPAWVAERLGDSRIVKVIRHCRVIDTSGKDVPLNGW